MYRRNIFLVFCAVLLAAVQPYSIVGALDKKYDQTFFSGNNILYYNPEATCTTAVSDIQSTVKGGTADENIQTILEYLVAKGMTLAGAAGAAGNIQTESGFYPARIEGSGTKLAPAAKKDASGAIDTSTIFKPKSGEGFGLVQWTFGGTSAPRQGPLYNTAVRTKRDIIDLGLQLDYLWLELSTGYKTSTLDRMKNSNDVREAAKVFMLKFEVPKDQSASAQNTRADQAEAIYNKYKSKISAGASSTTTDPTVESAAIDAPSGGCTTNEDGSSGGIGSANGFVFPLKTTQSKLKNGIEGAVWPSTKTTCVPNDPHHDYCAADIFIETGTPILAAKPGRVVNKKTSSCDYYGCSVTIMGDDNTLYYYTHMSKPASVDEGKQVKAGDVIGSVGTNATAMDTPRHLHFDMLPGSKYKFRPGCSGSSCTGLPFINVQTYLVPSFKSLPKE